MVILMILSLFHFWLAITGFGWPLLVLAGQYWFWPAITGFGRPLPVLAVFRPLPVLAGHYRFWPISTFGRNIYIGFQTSPRQKSTSSRQNF
jgi:hypothetical protein